MGVGPTSAAGGDKTMVQANAGEHRQSIGHCSELISLVSNAG